MRNIGIPPKKRMQFLDCEDDDDPLPLRKEDNEELERFVSETLCCNEFATKKTSAFTWEKTSDHTTHDKPRSNMFMEKDNRGRIALNTGEGTEYFDVVCTNNACTMYYKSDKSCIISIGSCAPGKSAFQCIVCGFKWQQWRKIKDKYGNLRTDPNIKPSNKRGRHDKNLNGDNKKEQNTMSSVSNTYFSVASSVASSTVPSTVPSTVSSTMTPISAFDSSVPQMTPMQEPFCMMDSFLFHNLAQCNDDAC